MRDQKHTALVLALREINAHASTALIQEMPSDDQIYMDHFRDIKRLTELAIIWADEEVEVSA